MVEQISRNAKDFGLPFIGMDDKVRQGIMHVIGPDLGLVQPGMVITAADSHTTTNGAFGAFSFGIGASEIKHVLATQSLWYRKPKTLRVTVEGKLGAGVTAKDVIIAIIAKVGISGHASMTVINGRIVWRDGEFPDFDEARLAAEARALIKQLDIKL